MTSPYFVLLLIVVGPELMQQEGETSDVEAFVGVSIAFVLFGSVFSAIIGLLLKKKPGMSINEC